MTIETNHQDFNQDTLQMTDTFKYKKNAIAKEPIRPGDFLASRNGKVSVLDEESIGQLLRGEFNDQI